MVITMSRILRFLVCFLLICSLVVNLLPVRSDASAAAVPTIMSAAGVTVSAPVALTAAAIALGVMVGTNDDFQNMVNSAASSLTNWVKDGAVELLQTIDETGHKAYYVAGDMLEDLRGWLDESSYTNFDDPSVISSYGEGYSEMLAASSGYLYKRFIYSSEKIYIIASNFILPCTSRSDGYLMLGSASSAKSFAIFSCSYGGKYYNKKTDTYFVFSPSSSSFTDLTLGSIPYAGAFTDGSSALEWASDYAKKALKVIQGSGDSDPDSEPPNDGKWFWPLALGTSVAVLGAMSQADEWSGETPQEFDDYSTNTEYEILSRPEFDSWQGIEIAPVTQPNPDPDPGTDPGTNPPAPGEPSPDPDPEPEPDPEPNPGTDPDADPDAEPKTISDIWQSIKELPAKITDAFSQKAPSSNMSNFTLDLSKYFPFCIPFDMYDFFTCLQADPVAPVIEWEIPLPGGGTYPLELDLSPFDPVAQLLRRLELLLFCLGLAFKTRDLIKG